MTEHRCDTADLSNGPGLLDIQTFVTQSTDVDWATVSPETPFAEQLDARGCCRLVLHSLSHQPDTGTARGNTSG